MGNAILQSYGGEALRGHQLLNELTKLADFDRQIRPEPMSSVVLIDEIDKAPRDFPNDLLNELDNMEFYIHELMNLQVSKPDNGTQVLIMMTSNFEKALPDAFLRRCLFYHIPFPDPTELIDIVTARIIPYLKDVYRNNPDKLVKVSQHLAANTNATITEFIKIREVIKDKAPTTSELLEWVKTLEKTGFFDKELHFDNLDAAQLQRLSQSFPALTKTEADQKRLIANYVRG
jgi:MoxR-like ATPase